MLTIDGILEALGPSAELAGYLGCSDRAVRAWRLRDRRSIPGKYWPAIVRYAKQRDLNHITYEALERAHDPLKKTEAA